MNCPICNTNNTIEIYKNENLTFTNKDISFDFILDLCNSCGYIYESSAYTEQYEKVIEYIYSNFNKNRVFPFPNRGEENISTRDFILNHLKNEQINVLEIGSNRGDMLYLLKEKCPNINILGVEPTKFTNVKVPTINAFFSEELFSCKFDFIILQHVFEHIKYPLEMVKSLEYILKDDGLLYIEVPNIIKSLEHCTEDFMPEHVSYFSESTLNKCFENFEVIKKDDSSFLRILYKKNYDNKNIELPKKYEVLELLDNYKCSKEKIISDFTKLQDGKKLVFYGVSYYFRTVFHDLKSFIDINNCYFYDDNIATEREDNFSLKKIENFRNDMIVILCSNNYTVQNKMINNLKNIKGLHIIKPWKEIIYND